MKAVLRLIFLFLYGMSELYAQNHLWEEHTLIPTDQKTPLNITQGSPFEKIAELVESAVISIKVKNIKQNQASFYEIQENESEGSGFIFNQQGYALSNYHVVENAQEILVTTYEGKQCSAEIIGVDPALDIAVLKLQTSPPFSSIPLGNSDLLKIGEWVMAVGNPLGLSHSITVGIVSAKGRQDQNFHLEKQSRFSNYIQTDASINPGNSGGPLVNQFGQVIGLNTAIIAKGQGIGFAIPINMIKRVLGDLIQKGYVKRSWLGIHAQEVSRDEIEKLKLDPKNYVKIASIIPGGPADLAGLEEEDVILFFNGAMIKTPADLSWLVSTAGVEKEAVIKVKRKQKEFDVKVKLGLLQTTQDLMPRRNQNSLKNGMKGVLESGISQGEVKGDQDFKKMQSSKGSILPPNFHGLYVSPLNKAQAHKLKLDHGIYVSAIYPESVADRAGMIRGDVILEINDQAVKDMMEFQNKLNRESKVLRFKINRGGKIKFIAFSLPLFLMPFP
jgi:serine protease Do